MAQKTTSFFAKWTGFCMKNRKIAQISRISYGKMNQLCFFSISSPIYVKFVL